MKISTWIALGTVCLVSSAMIFGANAAPSKHGGRRQAWKIWKELRQVLRAKNLVTRRSWFGPVEEGSNCSAGTMVEQGLELQTKARPFSLCEEVSMSIFN